MASKFLKENARHYYGKYSSEEFEDIIETDKCGASHNLVNKEHVEVFDEEAPEYERDIGVNKRSHEINQSYGEVTAEDYNVNKGGDGLEEDDPYVRRWLESLSSNCPEETEDDDE